MRTYQEITPEILTKLQQVAPGHVYTGDEINEDYSHDEMQIYGSHMPDVLIIPTSTEEISAVMKICNEYRVPVTTRGGRAAQHGEVQSHQIVPPGRHVRDDRARRIAL